MVGNGSRHILFDYDVEKELQKVADEVFDLSSCVCFNCLLLTMDRPYELLLLSQLNVVLLAA
ncbi:hypothetical protein OUZ56_017212 [Daphnia magna]|uniref:Uncharacterized protein n=1 Tax=Daphnia magna TaxID=35525 RepID=A0ABR0ASH4_9CRUS|nr:hypothetical protein OUZ56_017212 [Daphnia magna]